MKKFLTILLVLAVSLGMTGLTLATNDYRYDTEIYSVERQKQRLHELQELVQSSQLTVPLSSHGIVIPNINLILEPWEQRDYFIIGLEIEHDPSYEWERLEEIARQPVPDEIVDFILSFTGIPKENAFIGH
jgi:hypothetical protein